MRAKIGATKALILGSLAFIGPALVSSSSTAAGSWDLPDIPIGETQIEIMPPVPTSRDDISIKVSGAWSDSCAPEGSTVDTVGDTIFIDLSFRPFMGACFDVITSWEETVFVGRLADGTYKVVVRGLGFGVQQTFTVVAPVGGTASFLVEEPGSSAGDIAALAGGGAGALVVLASGAWYVRRRRLENHGRHTTG